MKTNKNLGSIITLALCIFTLILPTFALSSPGVFSNTRNISPSQTNGYAKLPLDKEIYSKSQNLTGDFRIFDSSGKEVPHFIHSSLNKSISPEIDAVIQNKGLTSGNIVLTLSLYNLPQTINSLRFDISSNKENNYLLKPELSGSDDQTTWVDIKTPSYIYKLMSKVSEDVNTIYMDPISFRYLKITLKPITGNITPEDISHVYYKNLISANEPEGKIENPTIVNTTVEKDRSTIIIDNGFKNAPIDRLNFHISNNDFTRQLTILGSNDQLKWYSITNPQEIYSLNIQKTTLSKTYIDTNKSNYQYIKAIFLNKDNSPLTISSVVVSYYPEYFIFNNISSNIYKAYYGGFGIQSGEYDTQKLQEILDASKLTPVNWASSGEKNPLYTGTDKPLTERNNSAITIVIVLMVIVLSWFIIKSLKGLKINNDPEDDSSDQS